MICIRCGRFCKHSSPTGMGPVCEKLSSAKPVPAHERDLFGYDPAKGELAALYRVRVLVDSMAAEAHMAIEKSFRAARVRLKVWA